MMKPSGCNKNSRVPIIRSANPIIREFLLVSPTFEDYFVLTIRLWKARTDQTNLSLVD